MHSLRPLRLLRLSTGFLDIRRSASFGRSTSALIDDQSEILLSASSSTCSEASAVPAEEGAEQVGNFGLLAHLLKDTKQHQQQGCLGPACLISALSEHGSLRLRLQQKFFQTYHSYLPCEYEMYCLYVTLSRASLVGTCKHTATCAGSQDQSTPQICQPCRSCHPG